jgi:diguanylate cyclase (GGDEF)-like protein/PAS domain S-box-containing protein
LKRRQPSPSQLPASPRTEGSIHDAVVRASFDSAPDGLVVVGADDRVLAYNPRFLALWNFPPDMLERGNAVEMREHSARQLKDPGSYRASLEAIAGTDRSQVFDEVELADGRVFERHVSPLATPGLPAGLVVRWRDVTTRRQAERALAQSQARLAAVVSHALNAILLADDQGLFLDANPAACQMLGYRHDELVGMPVSQVVLPGSTDLEAAGPGFLREGSARGRVQLQRRDGSRIVAQFNAVARMLPGVHLSVLSDITEEVRAQQRQQELSALLDVALLGADLAFWDVDLVDQRVRSVSGHWHAMLGYAHGEIGEDPLAWAQLVHPDDAAGRMAAWNAHVSGQCDRYEAEFRMRHKAGHWVWLHARGRAVARDAQGHATRVIGTRMDISARKQADERLRCLADTDPLTGAFNRRRFTELAADELARAARHGHALSLLMVDLDHFKAVNDRLGHAAGDQVLRAFVCNAKTLMRQGDVFARIGGEEFAALLPETGLEGAAAMAQRLLRQVREQPALVGGQPVPYTVSIGVVARPASALVGHVDEMMRDADRALYRCKAEGRDGVRLAASGTEPGAPP